MRVVYHDEVLLFIRKLQKPTQAKTLRSIELLESYGRDLRMPHVKRVENSIYELRIRGKQEVRVFFVVQDNKAILVHGFIKKTQKTPRHELETVLKRLPMLTHA